MTKHTVSVPDIGGSEGVDVIEVCIAVGDKIEKEQGIVVVETDKASMDIPSPVDGIVTSLSVSVGDKVSEGDLLIEVDIEAAEASAEPSAAETVAPETPVAEAPSSEAASVEVPSTETSSTEAPVASTANASEDILIAVPEGAEGAEIIELCVAEGDTVEEGDSLIVLETDKASMEIPATQAGTVTKFHVSVGDKTEEGMTIVSLTVEATGAAPSAASSVEASVSPEANTGASTETTVTVPDGAEDAEVIEICVAVGDEVEEGDSLTVLETDKASMEIPAPAAGKVISIAIAQGDKTVVGGTIAIVEVTGGSPAAAPVVAEAPKAEPAKNTPAPAVSESASTAATKTASKPSPLSASQIVAASQSKNVYAGPAVRKFAREMSIDLTQVAGSGERERILKADIKAYVKQVMQGEKAAPKAAAAISSGSGIPPIPAVDFSKFGEIELQPMSKIKKLTAANMTRNWLNVPHVTQWDDADITELEVFRKGLKAEAEKRGTKLTPLPFLLKACAAALVAEPSFNVSLHHDGEHIVQKHYVNIGVAVDSPVGLVVPVIRDVDKKGLWELADEFAAIITKARAGKLQAKDMQGGCFTISSLGAMGGQGFTPIVNAPEVAILGVSKADIKPKWNGSEFEPRNMLPLSLSYDHRAINGGDAGRFFTYLNSVIGDVRRLLL